MSSWSNRIKERMRALGLTQEMLAQKMGITRGAVAHYLAERRIPPLGQFKKLAAILKTDPAWLHYGTTAEKSSAKTDKKNTTVLPKKPIPILSWEHVADFLDARHIHEDTKEFVPYFYVDKPRWYALRIKGDAMTAHLGNNINFREGDIIIIDPERVPVHGNFIVALLPRAKEVTFKQYVIDGGIRYLKPLNPQYPLVEIDQSAFVCGVIVQHLNSC
jgi:SOS-response transcriptional repressor LexA